MGSAFEDQDLVICTNTGRLQDPRNVVRVMKRIVKCAKVPNIRFHDIRHTHASILISAGVDKLKFLNDWDMQIPKLHWNSMRIYYRIQIAKLRILFIRPFKVILTNIVKILRTNCGKTLK
ncbi:tyrosine-type recombinase/integrase [Psychrobacillus sp. FSL H8-0484]|uniref:tyrosine-type recombinase/integrase n=1 Tax=Psychrobacillus sp. FSL H8-0484 TaxID=2921390 RepID=UPI0040469C6B